LCPLHMKESKRGEPKKNKLGMPRNEVMGTGSILLLTNCSTSDENFPVKSPCVNHQKDLRAQYYIVKWCSFAIE
jgi:hypothetical protein